MAYLWDSNILRFYSAKHPGLYENLNRVSSSEILIPIVVYAEQLKGRIDGLLKAEPRKLIPAQERLKNTRQLLKGFTILDLDEAAITVAEQLKTQIKSRKRYADLIIAAQAIAGHHTLVTRNTSDFQDMMPSAMLQNWIDVRIG
jgi:predicted nucleic acid-binding protein